MDCGGLSHFGQLLNRLISFSSIPLRYCIKSSYLWGKNPVRNKENKMEDLKFASCLIPLIIGKKKPNRLSASTLRSV